jgi:ADP-dependent NAD(P)H-hydrate dehydratase / NAD(P)H-hydrate epimerase
VKVFNAQQIRAWDQYTIQHEPISSIDLMERAAQQCVAWLLNFGVGEKKIHLFCGKGNNGGDGLVIARLLQEQDIAVRLYILEFGNIGSNDFQTNLQRLHGLPLEIHFIQSPEQFPSIKENEIVVDALFGSGLNKPLHDLSAALVAHINKSCATVISIDVPSGLFLDQSSRGNVIVCAHHTLTFQCYKLALLMAENAPFIGEVHVLPIGLHPGYLAKEPAPFQTVEEAFIKTIYWPRGRFAHKGTFGHALIIGGSYGKIGAVTLAAGACLRAGAGLTTVYIPRCGYTVLQTALPEAMVLTDVEENLLTTLPPTIEKYNAIGVGPGIGTEGATKNMIADLVNAAQKPLVIDADGLNCLAQQQTLLKKLPPNSILTPHPKEFERLFGSSTNDFEKVNKAVQKAIELGVIIVLKGHHTFIALPNGQGFFNSTGNAGMAKGGSGDVLTGIITALLAQGYTPFNAAILGVYLHGLAGDLAANALSMEAMKAGDLVTFLTQAFVQIRK